MWGSYFPGIGALVPSKRLRQGSNETFDFFEKVLNIPSKFLLIRVNSEDKDLLGVVRERYGCDRVEVDSRNIDYYRHKYGMKGIRGRNFNIALRKPDLSNEFSDVGNILIIESEKIQLGVEIALGATTILKELFSLNHVQDCIPIMGIKTEDEALYRKTEDSIITCTVLFGEGLKPSNQHNRNRILKRYTQALSYFRAKLHLSLEELQTIITGFIKTQMPETQNITAKIIINSIKDYEVSLTNNECLAVTDTKIKGALNQLSNFNLK